MMVGGNRTRSVFVNCPFEDEYDGFLNAIVFTIFACGFQPVLALTFDHEEITQLARVVKAIRESFCSIHELTPPAHLRAAVTGEVRSPANADDGASRPRLNMAFELGLCFGEKEWGLFRSRKPVLLLADDRDAVRNGLSDLGGWPVSVHHNEIDQLITEVYKFLRRLGGRENTQLGPQNIYNQYQNFKTDFREIAEYRGWNPAELTLRKAYGEYINVMRYYIIGQD